jgi:molybdopterin molybdotransferase
MSSDLPSYGQAAAIVADRARVIGGRPIRDEVMGGRPRVERIDLAYANGRILAAPLIADDDQPPFPRSTRDGYACRAAEASAHTVLPVAGSTHAGEAPAGPLPEHVAWEIMTGAPVPEGADCVVMLEHVEKSGDASGSPATGLGRWGGGIALLSSRSIEPGDNIVAKGAQSRRGDKLLSHGVTLGPAQIALAASCGYSTLEVFARPLVAILTTGDELVPIDAAPGPGKIRNSNAPMLAALVANAGAEPLVLPTAGDTAEALDVALAQAAQADMLLISGGVSAGKFDLVEPALARLGAQFHFTGVRIQPGKPLVFGEMKGTGFSQPKEQTKIQRTSISEQAGFELGHDFSPADQPAGKRGALAPGKGTGFSPYNSLIKNEGALAPEANTIPFFGLPGNPISSALTFLLFAAPILAALAGSRETHPRFVLAQLARDTDRKTRPGLTRFLPARCTFNLSVDELPQVATVPWHGSGDLTAFAQSNCFLVIPEEAGFLPAGSTVHILLH